MSAELTIQYLTAFRSLVSSDRKHCPEAVQDGRFELSHTGTANMSLDALLSLIVPPSIPRL